MDALGQTVQDIMATYSTPREKEIVELFGTIPNGGEEGISENEDAKDFSFLDVSEHQMAEFASIWWTIVGFDGADTYCAEAMNFSRLPKDKLVRRAATIIESVERAMEPDPFAEPRSYYPRAGKEMGMGARPKQQCLYYYFNRPTSVRLLITISRSCGSG